DEEAGMARRVPGQVERRDGDAAAQVEDLSVLERTGVRDGRPPELLEDPGGRLCGDAHRREEDVLVPDTGGVRGVDPDLGAGSRVDGVVLVVVADEQQVRLSR